MMSCMDDRCWPPLTILAGLVNSPNSTMRLARLASPFTVFLVLVFALLVSAGKGGKKKGRKFQLDKAPLDVIPEEPVSYSPYQESASLEA
jgi:hypothetical protein